jgi:hypothetical protein
MTLELRWRIPVDLDPADTKNTIAVGPDESRIYVYAQAGKILVYSAKNDDDVGLLIDTIDPAQFSVALGPNPQFAKNNSSQLTAGFFLAR